MSKIEWQGCKAVCGAYCVEERVKDICEYYKMKLPTAFNIIRPYFYSEQTLVKKKMGRSRKFSPRGMRLLQKYVLDNFFDPPNVIPAKLYGTTKLHLS